METRHSMNTSLRNAKIFDDDSWDEVSCGLVLKKEKGESENHEDSSYNNAMPIGDIQMKTEIKQELFDEETNFPIDSDTFANIEIKKETLDELASPFKKVMIENSDSNSRQSFKSAKVSLYKKRESPYKKSVMDRLAPLPGRVTPLQLNAENSKRPGRKTSLETDPEVLSRRQKQIDYGKNTIGYDKYSESVPKNKRKAEDPQTPKKHMKYSRRGWDGLIKQWRLKLHKYDPTAN